MANMIHNNNQMNIMESDVSPISDFYCGKTVFLTGVTGFLGECFVVKLLRIGVKDVYVLIRNRKNMTAMEIFEKLKQSPIFEPLRKERPNFADHIIPICGTLDALELNISPKDQSVLFQNIQIIVHSAADVRFDVPISTATLRNIRGTRELLRLARKMENLENFIHISTAYSYCMRDVIGEDFYEPPVDSEVMIRIAEDIKNIHVLNTVRDKFIKPWPNTYTFSKAIIEDLVKKHANISRLLLSDHRLHHFMNQSNQSVSNFSGCNGVVAGIVGGVLRCLLLNKDVPVDMVFGDFVIRHCFAVTHDAKRFNIGCRDASWVTAKQCRINGALSAAYEVSTRVNCYPPIYNIVSGNDYMKTFDMLVKDFYPLRHKTVPLKSLWFPTFSFCHYHISYFICNIVLHVIPAAIVDTTLKLRGKKTVLLKLYRKINSFGGVINFFISSNFKFENNNMKRVLTNMTKRDKQIFACDFAEVNFSVYVDTYVYKGIIATLLGERSSRQQMKKNAMKMKIIHYSFIVFFALCAIFVFYMVLKHLCFSQNSVLNSEM